MNISLRWIVAVAVAASSAAAHAHHDWTEYDSSTPVKIAGFITASSYEYPHGHIQLQTADKVWLVVLAPPSRMAARGLSPDAVRPGARAEVVGYANRHQTGEMRARRITIDGRTIELR